MKYNKLNKKAIYIMTINALIWLVVLGIVIGFSYFIYYQTNLHNEFDIIFMHIGASIIGLYAILNVLVFPTIRYKRYAYLVTEDIIDVKKGLFVITRSVVPIIKVQKIAISNGPIDRLFNLSNIDIFNSAGVTKINFLENEKAEQLCNEINELLKKGEIYDK